MKYIHRKLPITFYDTPGISTFQKKERNNWFNWKKNQNLYEFKTKIHAVFYLLSGAVTRSFMDYEEEMFKLLLEKYKRKIKVYFIITQITNLEKYKNSDLPFAIENFKKVTMGLYIEDKYKDRNL